ncbi:putative exostosin [Helianthus annuus]|nr:putative exostosin [Helianthus annuus]
MISFFFFSFRGRDELGANLTRYGTGPDPSGRTLLLFITFIVIIYCYCILTREAQRVVVYTTLGCGLVETTPNWTWPIEWRLASLPTRFGGLGISTAEDASSYAFVASRAQSWGLQDHILRECGGDVLDSDYRSALDLLHSSLPDLDIGGFYIKDTAPPKSQKILANALYGEIVKRFKEKFVLSPRQRAVFECLRAPHAQDFLSVAPIEGLGQHMSAVEYRAILRYRLMIPLFPVDEPCPVCRKACLDSFGEHAIHCKELPGFKYWHDWVRDVLCDVLKRAGISAKKEAPVNFLTDPLEGRSTLRPADILVFGWEGGNTLV